MNSEEIIKLSREHINLILDLFKDSIFSLWEHLGREYSPEGIKSYLERRFDKEDSFGIFDNKGKLICYGSIFLDKLSNKKYAKIDNLLVSRDFQKKGLGKKMMAYLEKYAKEKGMRKVMLDVLKENPALDFYKKMNYKDYKLILIKDIHKA